MKPKYIFYLILILVMHYEVSRVIESNQQMMNMQQREMDDSSYQKDARLLANYHVKFTHTPKYIELSALRKNQPHYHSLQSYPIQKKEALFTGAPFIQTLLNTN